MKKLIAPILLGLLSVLMLSSCSMVDVKEGTMGVLVKRPYIFGSSGVELLRPDRHTIATSSTLILVDVQPDKKKESFNDLNTKDNSPVDFDIYFSIQVIPSEVHNLYSKFGLNYYEKSLQQELRNLTRDKCKQYDMNPLTNNDAVTTEINNYVLEEGRKIIKKLGIPVTLIAVNIGSINPPQQVIEERARTASAKQREQTIIQETKNEKERQSSEKARAVADRAYQENLGISTQQYIEILKINSKAKAYERAGTINIIDGDTKGLILK